MPWLAEADYIEACPPTSALSLRSRAAMVNTAHPHGGSVTPLLPGDFTGGALLRSLKLRIAIRIRYADTATRHARPLRRPSSQTYVITENGVYPHVRRARACSAHPQGWNDARGADFDEP